MSSLNETLDRLSHWWAQLRVPARIGVVVASAAAVTALVGVGIWSSRPQYTTLVNRLAPSEAAELVSKLDSEGIDHQLNFAASAILVPKRQWNRARMLIGDRALGGSAAPEWDDSVLGDPGLNQYKMLRHREQSLASSIRLMAGIADATVHIARPDRTPFIEDRQPATASVVVELQPGAYASRETAAAIVALVAGSVEGLDPDGVSIMDTLGRMMSSSGGTIDADVSSQFEYRRRLEADLTSKADMMLGRLLGERRAIVRVSADIDFTRTERTATIYDPDSKVPKTEEVLSTSITSASSAIEGVTGIRSLGARGRTTNTPVPQNEKTEDSYTDYEIGSSTDKVTESPGRIRRLTIAVMADVRGESSDPSDGETDTSSTSSVTQDQIAAIVKQATGFDESRGDQIEVLVTELAGFATEDDVLLQHQKWELYNKLIRSSSLGLASLVALTLGLLTIYRLRPIHLPAPSRRAGDRNRALSEFSDRVRQNPDVVKAVVSAWLDDDETGDEASKRAA